MKTVSPAKINKKEIEKLLLQAYRMGQESVTYMKVIQQGHTKVSHKSFCDDDPCRHKFLKEYKETTTVEDEMLSKLLHREIK